MDCDPTPSYPRDYPYCVDIPIPRQGLASMLLVILDAANACPGGAVVSTYGVPPAAEVRQWFNRIATRSAEDARRLALTFHSLGAREVQPWQ